MTVVETAYGKLRGTEIADGVLAWRGVPYAAPPVGELRLRPPAPPQAWAGVRDALAHGNRSLQPDPVAGPPVPLPPMAEDCLYLNVTAPAGAVPGRPPRAAVDSRRRVRDRARPRPGGRRRGVRAEPRTRRRDVQLPARRARVPRRPRRNPTGALGLHDQVAALRWTRQNIAAFGGDPEQITVYGLSAGGKSVTNLLASPLARGLIRRAAESSGGDHVKSPGQARDLTPRPAQLRPRRHHGMVDVWARQGVPKRPLSSGWPGPLRVSWDAIQVKHEVVRTTTRKPAARPAPAPQAGSPGPRCPVPWRRRPRTTRPPRPPCHQTAGP